MTRKDFELIADVLRPYVEAEPGREGYAASAIAKDLAAALRQTNALFDRSRFLRACGVEV